MKKMMEETGRRTHGCRGRERPEAGWKEEDQRKKREKMTRRLL